MYPKIIAPTPQQQQQDEFIPSSQLEQQQGPLHVASASPPRVVNLVTSSNAIAQQRSQDEEKKSEMDLRPYNRSKHSEAPLQKQADEQAVILESQESKPVRHSVDANSDTANVHRHKNSSEQKQAGSQVRPQQQQQRLGSLQQQKCLASNAETTNVNTLKDINHSQTSAPLQTQEHDDIIPESQEYQPNRHKVGTISTDALQIKKSERQAEEGPSQQQQRIFSKDEVMKPYANSAPVTATEIQSKNMNMSDALRLPRESEVDTKASSAPKFQNANTMGKTKEAKESKKDEIELRKNTEKSQDQAVNANEEPKSMCFTPLKNSRILFSPAKSPSPSTPVKSPSTRFSFRSASMSCLSSSSSAILAVSTSISAASHPAAALSSTSNSTACKTLFSEEKSPLAQSKCDSTRGTHSLLAASRSVSQPVPPPRCSDNVPTSSLAALCFGTQSGSNLKKVQPSTTSSRLRVHSAANVLRSKTHASTSSSSSRGGVGGGGAVASQ